MRPIFPAVRPDLSKAQTELVCPAHVPSERGSGSRAALEGRRILKASPASRLKLEIRHISNAVVLSRYDRVESVVTSRRSCVTT
jgi:hypothetical protein